MTQYARLTPVHGSGPWHIVKTADRRGYPLSSLCGVDLAVGPGAILVRLALRSGRQCKGCFRG